MHDMVEKLLIIGATSVIAHETAKCFAREKASFTLIARNKDKLDIIAEDLRQRGAEKVLEIIMDVNEVNRYESVLRQAVDVMKGLDIVLIAHGSAHDQHVCEKNLELVTKEIQTNFTSTACLLMLIADFFEQQKRGTIAVISSVAGDRGRRAQYLYASCKAAMTVFLQGLRQRLYHTNIAVVTIKPGLTDTPMTAHLKKTKRVILFAKPAVVGSGIHKAIKNRKEEVYLPWFWKYIMIIVKIIPEMIFKRMKF